MPLATCSRKPMVDWTEACTCGDAALAAMSGTPELADPVALAHREHNTEARQWYGRWLLMEHGCLTPNRHAKKIYASC